MSVCVCVCVCVCIFNAIMCMLRSSSVEKLQLELIVTFMKVKFRHLPFIVLFLLKRGNTHHLSLSSSHSLTGKKIQRNNEPSYEEATMEWW